MGTYRNQGTLEAFRVIYRKGGAGAFWAGWQPKMVESFLKGGILMFTKEGLIRFCTNMGMGEGSAGLIGGFGGGVAQVSIMGPCTFLVTAAVTGDKSVGLIQQATRTYKAHGIGGFYHGGTALILRQGWFLLLIVCLVKSLILALANNPIGTNWASRQGFTDIIRSWIKKRHVREGESVKDVKLSVAEEAISGIIGGALSTWNQPFEVMRIEAQANAAKGLPPRSFVQTYHHIVKESGYLGLFQGVIPRMGLCIGQTLFLVTVPHLLKPYGF